MTQTRFKCTCPKCTRDGKPFTSVSESTYHAHQKDVPTHMRVSKRSPVKSNVVAAALTALTAIPCADSPFLEEQEDPCEHLGDGYDYDCDYDFLPLDPESQARSLDDNDDVYYSCDEEDYSDDENDESEDEPEVSHHTIDNSKIPKEPIAYILFQMVTVFQAGRMTEDDTEMMMAMCNLALQSAGEEYRFPKKASTVSNHNHFQERACAGLMSCPVCVKCSKIFPSNTAARLCDACQTELFKASSNLPRKIYMYNSVTTTLKNFMARPSFVASLSKWTTRQEVPGRFMDIYDGAVWKTFKTNPNHSVPFVQESVFNLMLTLNVDWFQPYKGTQHSTGAIYLTIQNMPRDERNLRKNVMLVGLIPGPSETKVTEISHFLSPLVEELLVLQDGVPMRTHSNGVVTVKAALTLVGCDLPAAKKVSGFTALNSKNPCHKCHMSFPSCPGHTYKRDFSNFDMTTWTPRTKEETYQEALLWKNSAPTERANLEATNGTRWTVLYELPYFDSARFTVIDPMHNLFLGTCLKMVRIWTANAYVDDIELLTKATLRKMKAEGKKIILPSGEDCGPIMEKLESGKGFSGLKADEWRVWCHSLSPVLLKGNLSTIEFDHWMLFVDATCLLCQPSITMDDLNAAGDLMLKFCSQMASIYAVHKVMSNMHFHMHLFQGILDFGPVYGYWLFNFERYNGDVKLASTNRKGAIERTFAQVFLKKVHLEDYLHSIPTLAGSETKQAILDVITKNTKNGRSSNDTYEELKSISRKHYEWTRFLTCQKNHTPFGFEPLPYGTIASISPPLFKSKMAADHYPLLFKYYQSRYTSPFAHHSTSSSPFVVTNQIEKIKSLSILGQKFNFAASRSEKGSYIRAKPIFSNDDGLVSGQVLYFFQHKLSTQVANGEVEHLIYTFAMVRWFKSYSQVFQSYKKRGLEVWRDEYLPLSEHSILPISRIYSPVGVMKWLPEENLNVVIPLPQKIIG